MSTAVQEGDDCSAASFARETPMQRADQLIMDRPIVERPSAVRSDQIKSILFHVHEDDGLDGRLQAALSLTRACSAHLELIQIIPIEAYTLVDAYASYVSGEIVQALEEDAAKVRARLEAQLSKEDVSWSFEVTT
jgi:hypothetical protein